MAKLALGHSGRSSVIRNCPAQFAGKPLRSRHCERNWVPDLRDRRGRSLCRATRALVVVLNALMGLPPVVVGLLVYRLLSRAGPLGSMGMLFTPAAMIIAQAILITSIIAAFSRQAVEDAWVEYRE